MFRRNSNNTQQLQSVKSHVLPMSHVEVSHIVMVRAATLSASLGGNLVAMLLPRALACYCDTSNMLLQKRCFAVWFLFCGVVTVCTLRSTDVAHLELFYIYYQPLLPVLTMLWLWGINVRYFERIGVRYDVCFSSKDQKYLLHSREIFQVSLKEICTRQLSRQLWHSVSLLCLTATAPLYTSTCVVSC